MRLFDRHEYKEKGFALLSGMGIGALLMYVLDRERGARRRALARDQAVAAYNKTAKALGKSSRDLANRSRGVAAKTKSLLKSEPVSDEVLVQRVRSKIGHAVSHPGALEVVVSNGLVTLSGPVLASDSQELLAAVRSVPGVEDVENFLEAHDGPEGAPGLQGTPREERDF